MLVVEDDPVVQTLVYEVLRKCGHTVFRARDGLEAIELVKKGEAAVDMLVTDVIMPKMNGKALYQRLAVLVPDLKVLYISGYPGEVITERGVADSGSNFLQKPFSVNVLINKVNEILNQ